MPDFVLSDITGTHLANIANGESLSGVVDLGSFRLAGIVMPAAWTAADITFQASADGVTYVNLMDTAAAEVSTKAAASQAIQLDPNKFLGFQYLKVRSGTSAVPVAQGAARTITLLSIRKKGC